VARILDWDHNWDVPASPLAVLADSVARRYVGGVAWHCYAGDVRAQDSVHAAFPATDAYFTECSGGGWATNFGDNLKFDVGKLIIGTTRGWARGVALWNLALDERSGPHLGGCDNCRGVITIDSHTGAVTRNVEYYALAHASTFVRPGARRIASTSDVGGLQSVAFRNGDDGSTVLIVLNGAPTAISFAVRSGTHSLQYALPAGAVVTLRWR
jgi:glucosylceramidase